MTKQPTRGSSISRKRFVFALFALLSLVLGILIVRFSISRSGGLPHHAWELPLVFSNKDPNRLAVGYSNGVIVLWNSRSGERLATFKDHNASIESLCFSHDDSVLASCSEHSIVLREAASHRYRVLDSPLPVTKSLSLSPSGDLLAVGGGRNEVFVMSNTKENQIKLNYSTTMPGRVRLVFSPNGKYLAAAGDYNSSVIVWTVEDWTEHDRFVWKDNRSTVYGMAFSPDGSLLALGGWKQILIWDVANKHMHSILQAHSAPVTSVAFSPDGRYLASVEDNDNGSSNVKLWDTSSWGLVSILGSLSHGGLSLVFSPDGELLAVGSSDAVVRLWSMNTKTQLGMLP